MFMQRNRSPERFADGRPKGLNAVGAMQVDRLRKQWQAEWEVQQHNVSAAEVSASIDRKVADIRRRSDADRQRDWERLSLETRDAWDAFERLRNRDLDAMRADEDLRRPLHEGPREDVPALQPSPKQAPLELEPPKTAWTLKDEGFR
ncbi:hypothetical protein J3454_01040 [Erythrobacter sp. NFXS35]|uniref:hypothetical protein n=1 Tax=Erythrobacter sp. NFXS35 TaxID=2818436 RepID=UPI0032DFE89E